jgi:hypothetical protein
MTKNKNSNEEDISDDELDFYDFVEVISDKIDSITDQSIEKNVSSFLKFILFYFFIVEERKQDSLQRWQQTKDDVDERKRLLKIELENHVRVLSENFKKPNFIRIRDKIIFTLGVANACFSPLIGIISFFSKYSINLFEF